MLEYTVTEIDNDAHTDSVPENSPFSDMPNAGFLQLMFATINQKRKAYSLEWHGDRVPTGAVVNGKTIAWTQHGFVKDKAGENIGTYERVVDDLSQQPQKMIIYMDE